VSNVNIPASEFKDFVCMKNVAICKNPEAKSYQFNPCGGSIFTPVMAVKTYQGFLSQSQKVIMSIQLFKCEKCGAIHDVNKPQDEAHGGLTMNQL